MTLLILSETKGRPSLVQRTSLSSSEDSIDEADTSREAMENVDISDVDADERAAPSGEEAAATDDVESLLTPSEVGLPSCTDPWIATNSSIVTSISPTSSLTGEVGMGGKQPASQSGGALEMYFSAPDELDSVLLVGAVAEVATVLTRKTSLSDGRSGVVGRPGLETIPSDSTERGD
jgi:hypothetical protein